MVIDFARVQSKVALKYDAWHKEVLGKFGALLGGEMVQFHGRLAKSRSQLEHQSIGMFLSLILLHKHKFTRMLNTQGYHKITDFQPRTLFIHLPNDKI